MTTPPLDRREAHVTPTQYQHIFSQFRWLIVACVAIGIAIAIGLSAQYTATTTTSSTVLLSSVLGTDRSASEAYSSIVLAQQRMATYAELAKGDTLEQAMLSEGGLGIGATALSEDLDVVVATGSTAMTFVVHDTDPGRARLIADRAATSMVTIINRIETQNGGRKPILHSMVTAKAREPRVPEPPAWRNPLLGAAGGLVGGLGLAVLLARRDARVYETTTLREVLGAPALGVLPVSRRHLRPRRRRRATWDDAVRELRTSLYFARDDDARGMTIALVSPRPIGQLPRAARDVATALAATDARILLVDADLSQEHPRRANGGEATGLSGCLAGSMTLAEATQRGEVPGVDVLPCGSAVAAPDELLHTGALATLLDESSSHYDFVLVATAAGLRGTGATAVAARCDGIVLMTPSRARLTDIDRVLRAMQAVHARVLGGVLLT